MEGIEVNFMRNKFKGFPSIRKCKAILFKNYPNKNIDIDSLEVDHIIPYCISLDSSLQNLQLLTHSKHLKKSIIDKKITKILKEKGFIEKITNYSHEIKVSLEEIKKEYLNLLVGFKKHFYKGLVGLVELPLCYSSSA